MYSKTTGHLSPNERAGGYPSRWLAAPLNKRSVGFCMHVEKAGNAGFA
ncbi:hypothetical protein SAMN05880566_1442 [Janthinobacterium sp. TND4EL3]|nr:hypothetical protein SAMN05880566_1442 [Janthinobacterium sp. TND4EL3]